MQIQRLWLNDFRSYNSLELELDLGLTAFVADNGQGKTNLLEALGVLATLKSFRGSPVESMVAKGAEAAVVRAEGLRDDREVLIELELRKGRTRAQVNRQKLKRTKDLLGALRVTVFAPDDLRLLKEGPGERRTYLDDVLVALNAGTEAVIANFERALKQRNALLRQAGGRLDESTEPTLDVWDTRLVEAGRRLVEERRNLVQQLGPLVQESYDLLAARPEPVEADVVGLDYVASWGDESPADKLAEVRQNDVRRGVTTVGPHRDELTITLNGLSSRTEASQGEQRTLALALRLGGHRLLTDMLGEPPLLLLDDVLSELDNTRADALLRNLPSGQTVITSATELPETIKPDRLFRLSDGVLSTG